MRRVGFFSAFVLMIAGFTVNANAFWDTRDAHSHSGDHDSGSHSSDDHDSTGSTGDSNSSGTDDSNSSGTDDSNSSGTDDSNSSGSDDNDSSGSSDDNDTDSGSTEQEKKKEKRRVEFDLTPIFDLDFDFAKKIINLTPQSAENGSRVVLDDNRAGFRVVQSLYLEAGLGVVGSFHYSDAIAPFVRPFIGVLPIGQSATIADRFAANKSEIKNLPDVQIPYRASDLDNWSVSDSLVYQVSGGVLFMAGLTYSPVAVGSSYLVLGDWSVYVTKTGEKSAYVKFTSTKLKELSQTAGTALIAVSKTKFRSADEGFSFTFDLRDPAAAMAYEDMLKGNIKPAQEMALRNVPSIRLELSMRARKIGRFTSLWLGIPIFANARFSSGTISSVTHTVSHLDSSKSDVEYGIFRRSRKSRVMFHHRSKTETFYGAAYKNSDAEGAELKGRFGSFVWSYENDKAQVADVRDALAELAGQTGIRGPLALDLPSVGGGVGYAGIKFVMTIPESAGNALIQADAGNALGLIDATASGLATKYFSQGKDRDGLCAKHQPNVVLHPDLNDALKYNLCRDEVVSETRDGVASARKAIHRLARYRDSNRTQFVKAYAELGKAMLTNQFVFQAVLSATGGNPIDLEFLLEGERFSRLVKKASWVSKAVQK